jgi:hypothetical protein
MTMKSAAFVTAFWVGAGLLTASAALAQTTQTSHATQTETKYRTVEGEVVRYDPGRLIVVRGADNKETRFTLAPNVDVPTEVRVGRLVTLFTEPGRDGTTQLVSRVTTTSYTLEGDVKRTTEDTRHLPSGVTTLTTTTKTFGKVEVYEVGKALTLTRFDGSKVTYVINERSKVPADLAVGKTVSVLPLATGDTDEPVAQTITYLTTTRTETLPER